MKRNIIIFIVTISIISGVYSQNLKLNMKTDLATAKGVLIAFFSDINIGKYNEALSLFKTDPVKNGELSFDDFIIFCETNISKNKTILSLDITEKIEDKSSIRLTVCINYKDKTQKIKWVILEKIENNWKMTTKGSLF